MEMARAKAWVYGGGQRWGSVVAAPGAPTHNSEPWREREGALSRGKPKTPAANIFKVVLTLTTLCLNIRCRERKRP